MADLMFRPVDELAGMVRSGEISARELVQESIDRIDEHNPQLNAFVDVFADEALAEADAISPGDERPFAGVPIAVKNNRAIAGKRYTLAAEFMGEFVAMHDDNVVRRLKEAGFVIVGSTTLPEWGILPVTDTKRFGTTRNPYDLERTPGGSSGGSAAAVASGMVPIAHGNDGGGSTRIPAACVGLVGLKPQRGRISTAPIGGGEFLVQDGVLTRTTAETAALLDILAGYEPGDPVWAPDPAEPFAVAAAREPGRLRIALTSQSPIENAELDEDAVRSVRETGELLASLGHEVVEADPPWRQPGVLEMFTACFGPLVGLNIAFAEILAGREATADDMEPLSWGIWQLCKNKISSIDSAGAQVQISAFSRQVIGWMSEYDALVTPALAEAPVKHGVIDPMSADPMGAFARSGTFTPFTALFNVSGQPAITLPLFDRTDGVATPLSAQLVGRPGGEGALLALSAQLEAAAPWAHRRPALATA
ncbi:MAG: amidase [Solirubrobacterales bacterium]|nr:amidase [Solirubrobacterales bacterium]